MLEQDYMINLNGVNAINKQQVWVNKRREKGNKQN